jgi:hypothetical protein
MNLSVIFNSLCQPAQLYLILAMISFVLQIISILIERNELQHKIQPITIHLIVYILVTIIWVWLLNQLCKYGGLMKNISWFIAIFPIIIFLMMLMGVINALSQKLVDGNLDEIVAKCQ